MEIPDKKFEINNRCIRCGGCAEIAPNNFIFNQHRVEQPRNEQEGIQCNKAADKCPAGAIKGEAFSTIIILLDVCSRNASACGKLCVCEDLVKATFRGACIMRQPENLRDIAMLQEVIPKCPYNAIGFEG